MIYLFYLGLFIVSIIFVCAEAHMQLSMACPSQQEASQINASPTARPRWAPPWEIQKGIEDSRSVVKGLGVRRSLESHSAFDWTHFPVTLWIVLIQSWCFWSRLDQIDQIDQLLLFLWLCRRAGHSLCEPCAMRVPCVCHVPDCGLHLAHGVAVDQRSPGHWHPRWVKRKPAGLPKVYPTYPRSRFYHIQIIISCRIHSLVAPSKDLKKQLPLSDSHVRCPEIRTASSLQALRRTLRTGTSQI